MRALVVAAAILSLSAASFAQAGVLGVVSAREAESRGIRGCGASFWPRGDPTAEAIFRENWIKGLVQVDGRMETLRNVDRPPSRGSLSWAPGATRERTFRGAGGAITIVARFTVVSGTGDLVFVRGTLDVSADGQQTTIEVDGAEEC